jgi:hypothetical protein
VYLVCQPFQLLEAGEVTSLKIISLPPNLESLSQAVDSLPRCRIGAPSLDRWVRPEAMAMIGAVRDPTAERELVTAQSCQAISQVAAHDNVSGNEQPVRLLAQLAVRHDAVR